MPKNRSLTKVQKRVVAQIERGTMLRTQYGEPKYFFDGGNAVNERTVRSLLKKGVLQCADDGLLPGETQTLVLA